MPGGISAATRSLFAIPIGRIGMGALLAGGLAANAESATPTPAALTLAADGKTSYVIAVSGSAIPAEQTAAQQLARYLKEITGAEFRIVTDTQAVDAPHRIVVGRPQAGRDHLADIAWDRLGNDGIVIRTVGDDLFLAGGLPRGTLYAVFTFLEDVVGCRWWTPTESMIPRRATLTISVQDTVYVPQLIVRDMMYRHIYEPEFLVHQKLNGHYMSIPDRWGGRMLMTPDFCHTFYKLLPPDRYFAAHPDWYSLLNGKRTTSISQLCLTNEPMKEEMIRQVLTCLKDSPEARIVSVTQNDSPGGQCQCPTCAALEALEGSPAGPLLHFVNAIADAVAKERPDVFVETLAYQYTRPPPLRVKPRDNVIIRLCAGSGCRYDVPFAAEGNAQYAGAVRAWSAIARNLFAWDYVTNFAERMAPHPNWRTIAPNIRFLAQNRAMALFAEGDHWNTMGDLVRMRAWVMAHLMWNPTLDGDALMQEFAAGYYGPAGPHILAYLSLLCNSFEQSGSGLTSSGAGLAYMSIEQMNQATRGWDSAEEAVANDATLLARVRRDRMTFNYLWLARYPDLKQLAAVRNTRAIAPLDPLAACEEIITLAKATSAEYGDGVPLATFMTGVRTRLDRILSSSASAPPECAQLPRERWLDIQSARFQVQCDGEYVDDPLASDGTAVAMGGGHGDWSILCPISGDWLMMMPSRTWTLYAVVRCEIAQPQRGSSFGMGIFDYGRWKEVSLQRFPVSLAADGKYHTYTFGTFTVNPGMGFWFAPAENPDSVKGIYVDRIFAIADEPTPAAGAKE
jgi:hypothetical protein